MKKRSTVVLPLALVLAGCGGGSSGPSGTDDVGIPGTDNAAFGQFCQLDYYQTLIGTYRGVIEYQSAGVNGQAVRDCAWNMTAEIGIEINTFRCALDVRFRSAVEQRVVLAADDPFAYQCIAENSQRRLQDPNVFPDLEDYDDIVFPVNADVLFEPSVPRHGPYFGDESVLVPYTYLIDGPTRLLDILQFDGEGGMRWMDNENPPRLTGQLIKE